jgi:hypothetical protein
MVERFLRASILGALCFCAPAYAQAPAPTAPATELDLAQEQLLQLHKMYDQQERDRVMIIQKANTAVKAWQDYYNSCKPAEKWLCDE